MTDVFMEQAMHRMAHSFETYGAGNSFEPVLTELDEILEAAKGIMDSRISPKPLIGIVGEIFLRMHRDSNQDLIRVLEKYGAEVENASMSEWVNYVSYAGLRQARKSLALNLRLLRLPQIKTCAKEIMDFGMNLLFQETTQKAVYRRAQKITDLAGDHKISTGNRNCSGIFLLMGTPRPV
jgi:predicted nucleotide-binding protein (sugar kinase/HSP70/actin superfamily)